MAAKTEQQIGQSTFALAEWTSSLRWKEIPDSVRERVKQLVLDGIGCSVFGVRRDAGKALHRFVARLPRSSREATIWGAREVVDARAAGFVNGAAAHTTNVGDTHRATILHTNYVTPQAAIAIGERLRASGREVLAAIVAGNEAGTRAGLAARIGAEGGYFTEEGRGWHATGTFGPLAAAVAAGRVLRLRPHQMVQALLMGGAQITGMYRPCGAYMGKHWYAGKAVANGIEAAELAAAGFIAGYRYFEDGICHPSGTLSPVQEPEAALSDLGSRWETLNVDMAIYPTKKIYYPNIDAVLRIMHGQKLRFRDVQRIVVRSAFARAHDFGAFRAPANSTEAFNSLRHSIAAATHDGEFTFRQLEPRTFRNREVVAFSRDRIEVRRDLDLERMLPEKWPGAVEIVTRDDRRFSLQVDHHRGQTQLPLSRAEVEAKFRSMTRTLGARRTERVLALVDCLETLSDVTVLTRELRPG